MLERTEATTILSTVTVKFIAIRRLSKQSLGFIFCIDQYRAQIKKLQDSEAEIKAVSVNYAALLKEKEVHLINEVNSSLKQNLMFVEMSHIRNDLNHEISEIEKENSSLKTEKDKLVVALKASTKNFRPDVSETLSTLSNSVDEVHRKNILVKRRWNNPCGKWREI
ncbi:hypothetical protein POM88_032948 [Heracleum sosnowskyi]|uniref:Uncharacterized protein n=1 Tax=Heracleum sosnowskyi TaxID=360622 RepID=A0AAD8MI04_9APIA|nr:hypothetical protein POM88_032948 [Heracleum sosnowskyi]